MLPFSQAAPRGSSGVPCRCLTPAGSSLCALESHTFPFHRIYQLQCIRFCRLCQGKRAAEIQKMFKTEHTRSDCKRRAHVVCLAVQFPMEGMTRYDRRTDRRHAAGKRRDRLPRRRRSARGCRSLRAGNAGRCCIRLRAGRAARECAAGSARRAGIPARGSQKEAQSAAHPRHRHHGARHYHRAAGRAHRAFGQARRYGHDAHRRHHRLRRRSTR